MTPKDMGPLLADDGVDTTDTLARAIDACLSCALITVSCADTCLSGGGGREDDVLACLDCADRCTDPATLAFAGLPPDRTALRAALVDCIVACRACAAQFERHGADHDPCAVCAEECRACLARCEVAVTAIAV